MTTGAFASFSFDPPTFFAGMAFYGAVFAAMAWAMARRLPATIRGMGDAAVALACLSITFAVLLWSAIRPGDWSTTLVERLTTNSLMQCLVIMCASSLYKLTDRAVPWRWMGPLAVLGLVCGVVFTFVIPHEVVQRATASLVVTACLGFAAWGAAPSRHQVRGRAARYFTMFGLGGVVVVMLLRMVFVVTGSQSTEMGHASPIQLLVFAGIVFGLVTMILGSTLISSERVAEEIERMGMIDPLTELYNRGAFLALARAKLDAQAKSAAPGGAHRAGLLMLDIDHFKRINDTFGHDAGDRAIQACAELVKDAAGAGSLVARYGGEEFVVYLPNATGAQLAALGETIRARAAAAAEAARAGQLEQAHGAGRTAEAAPVFTVSVGGTLLQVPPGQLATAIERADAALYEAKRAGRDQVRLDSDKADDLTPLAGTAAGKAPALQPAAPATAAVPGARLGE